MDTKFTKLAERVGKLADCLDEHLMSPAEVDTFLSGLATRR
jgi:hypothetical protein